MATAPDIKNLDKLELNPSRPGGLNTRTQADRMQRMLEIQELNAFSRREMIEQPALNPQTLEYLKKMPMANEAPLKADQIGEFTRLSYSVGTDLLSTEDQNVARSIKSHTGQNLNAKKPKPQKERGYHAKQEEENSAKYKRVA